VPEDSVGDFRLFLTVPPNAVPKGSVPITLTVRDEATGEIKTANDVFVGPDK
jgi:hypothetical protein